MKVEHTFEEKLQELIKSCRKCFSKIISLLYKLAIEVSLSLIVKSILMTVGIPC